MYILGSPQELIILLVIVLVLFGGKKIPEIMRGLGQGLSEFRKATGHAQEELKSITLEPPPAAPAAPAAAPEPAAPPTAAPAAPPAAPPADNSAPPAQPPA
jgi:sec-independent protein translocase protein TatA